ncbi:hypothetical protein [Microvirga sp. VF16]|uniref:hypothetical protein n=1 Tax=Microvirga sp. VF16 TaxID=2807101 RepID=UPI00193D937B|nr:hypothetical protein [Microvirga sp. VF16]QRM32458.1 hypothetical protein JO965_30650 [Microvirga sp. VF16]
MRAAVAPAASVSVDFRQVHILRGALALAVAQNWFVPQRLVAGMENVLQTTDLPFGAVIARLRPSRRTLAAHIQPLTADPSEDPSQLSAPTRHAQPAIILEHTTVILSEAGTALALVTEPFFSDLVSIAATQLSSSRGLDERSQAGPAMQPVRLER